MALEYGWEKRLYRTDAFDLTGYTRTKPDANDVLTVYLEGDGKPWRGGWIPDDPTPEDALVLNLALRHPGGSVLYLAKPCQYVAARPARGCHPAYWSTHRYAEEVVASLSEAIDQAKERLKARRITLIGYSGGGVAAALLAARRADVDMLITIAANLDHAYWTRIDGLTPLYGSLNPIDFINTLQRIPQRHFIGADDEVVSPSVVDSYVRSMTDRSNTRVIVIKGIDHDCCWIEKWPALLNR